MRKPAPSGIEKRHPFKAYIVDRANRGGTDRIPAVFLFSEIKGYDCGEDSGRTPTGSAHVVPAHCRPRHLG